MRSINFVFAFLVPSLVVFGILVSCAPSTTAPSAIATPAPQLQATKPVWQSQWEKMVADGQREGKVSIYSSMASELRAGLGQAFKEKFGITPDFYTGKAAEVTVKIMAERRAGIYLADVVSMGPDNFLYDFKPAGTLQSLDPFIVLPEVLDKQVWFGGQGLRFIDKEHTVLRMLAYMTPSILINTNLVRPEDTKSYKDLLSPKWKGKIVMGDPTVPGTAGAWFRGMALSISGPEYLKELAKQEPVILRDDRLLVDWVAKDKYAIALALKSDIISEYIRAGSPLKNVIPTEGANLTSGGGCVVLMNSAPHPNAAAVFINWMLTREAQTLRSQIERTQSARLDVPTDHLETAWLRNPSVKYYDNDDEKMLTQAADARKLATDIFGPLMAR